MLWRRVAAGTVPGGRRCRGTLPRLARLEVAVTDACLVDAAVGGLPGPPGRDPLNPPPPNEFRMIKSAEKTSHLKQAKNRRSQADGDGLMAESLRRRDHPEEFRDVWTAGPSPRRKA